MIRVNLIGGPKKVERARSGLSIQLPTNLLPLVWVGVVLGAAVYGYLWYSDLNTRSADLTNQIAAAEAQKAQLQSVIDEDAVYEARKSMLEQRIEVIEDLQRNQVSPVVSLDILSQALEGTEWVWLDQLAQDDTSFSMSGTGTSIPAIADFVSSLEETGYFRNINLVNAQDDAGNFTFQMNCDFVPPALPGESAEEDSGELAGNQNQ